jgi:hypothetical protein
MSSFSGSLNPTADRPATILEEADKAVDGTRQENYGHPAEDFKRIASYWSNHLNGIAITPHDVALMMIMVKLSRLHNTPYHRDSLIDIAGYARCAEKVYQYGGIGSGSVPQNIPITTYR